jgi:ribosomal protein S18 acetylase RimI-like enzyme
MNVRRARPADLEVLLSLCERYCEIDLHTFYEPSARSAFLELLSSDDRGFVLVAESGGAVVGYAVVTWGFSIESGGLDALLDELYVENRGEGIGSVLMQAAMDDAAGAGAGRMFLETEAHNRRARMFYTHHEFTIESSVWMSRELGAPSLKSQVPSPKTG